MTSDFLLITISPSCSNYSTQ